MLYFKWIYEDVDKTFNYTLNHKYSFPIAINNKGIDRYNVIDMRNYPKYFKEISEEEFFEGKSKRKINLFNFIIELLLVNDKNNDIIALEIYKKLQWNKKT